MSQYATHDELALSEVIEQRKKDWRVGAIVYQVLVDRFAPSKKLPEKSYLYPAPKLLKEWTDVPKHGKYIESERLWSHEIEFWGGDLTSLSLHIDYIKQLGADVVYLNPIHYAYTNHKYDALDFDRISPEFGTEQDLAQLLEVCHQSDLKVVLDGVFNHMGQNSEKFLSAKNDKQSPYKDWFYFSEHYPSGHRAWDNAVNLPELNLENLAVRKSIYLDEDSTVQRFLRMGVDGWRLDVAHDIGFTYLNELTDCAHQSHKDSLIIGEVWSFPEQWLSCLDGIMNLTMRHVILQSCQNKISARMANLQIEQIVAHSDYEGLLKSWLLLDNHDTPRLANELGDFQLKKLAQVLQFSLPGSPNLYYGSELGMTGGDDPEMRAPMRWDLVSDNNKHLKWLKSLMQIRKENCGLSVGEFKSIHSDNLICFLRYTEKVEDACIVVVNPSEHSVTEQLMLPYSKLMNMGAFIELIGDYPHQARISASFLGVDMPAKTAAIFKPQTKAQSGYTTYKRVW
ncbi:MAG: glycoside hydrolase family 13 protein [Gammaproteobacteria bacterium]|nr:glycoside hydrolase family 13 protein [Gammaproteobacteria bacterium]